MSSPLFNPPAGARVNWGNSINRGLVACWLFNEGGGTRFKNIAGTGILDLASTANPPSKSGMYGPAVSFNGSTQYMTTTGNIGISGATKRTVSLWAMLAATPGGAGTATGMPLLWWGTANNNQLYLLTLDSSVFNFYGYFADLHGTKTLSVNVWYHLVITYDGTNTSTYINGVQDINSAQTMNTVDSTINIATYSPWSGAIFNGSMNNIRIYNRLLTLGEIRRLYEQPFAGIASASPQPANFSGISFDAASNSGIQTAQSTYTFNRTVSGSDRYLTVDIALLSAGATVTSVVDDSGGGNVNLTFIGAQTTVTSFGRVETWGLVAPILGTKSIQVNLSGSITSVGMAVSYNGVHQTLPYEAFNSAQATNVGAADATVTVTPIANNTWIHAALATDDAAVTPNQTSRNNVSGGATLSGADEDTGPITPAAATAVSYTGVGAAQTWAIGGVALRPIAASGVTSTFTPRRMMMGVGF